MAKYVSGDSVSEFLRMSEATQISNDLNGGLSTKICTVL